MKGVVLGLGLYSIEFSVFVTHTAAASFGQMKCPTSGIIIYNRRPSVECRFLHGRQTE